MAKYSELHVGDKVAYQPQGLPDAAPPIGTEGIITKIQPYSQSCDGAYCWIEKMEGEPAWWLWSQDLQPLQ